MPGLAAGVALVPSGNAVVGVTAASSATTSGSNSLSSSLERLAVTVDKEGGLSSEGATGVCVCARARARARARVRVHVCVCVCACAHVCRR